MSFEDNSGKIYFLKRNSNFFIDKNKKKVFNGFKK